MKRNFFKNSLAAFAFTMAIVASFAFSPIEAGEVDGYKVGTLQQPCLFVQDVQDICEIAGAGPTCTISGDTIYQEESLTVSACSIELTEKL